MSKTKRLEVRQPILTNADLEKIRSISEVAESHFKSMTLDTTWPAEAGAAGMASAIDALCNKADEAVRDGINIIILSDRRAGADRIPIPVAARLRRRASSPDPRGSAHLGRPRGGIRRAARGAPFRLPRRLRRRGDQSLSRLRDADRDEGRFAAKARREGNRQALHQVDRQGPAQGDVEDGHLDLPVLLRCADFRRGRPQVRFRRTNTSPAPRPASKASASPRSPKKRCAGIATPSATRRSTAPCSTSAANMRCACAARITSGTRRRLRHCSTRCAAIPLRSTGTSPRIINEQIGAAVHDPRPVPHQVGRGGRAHAGADRGGRAGEGDRQALLDRRHVVRLDLARGAHHARDRHEPDRRQVEYRRGRRRSRPLQAAAERRFDALGDQAGGVGPLRRHRRISRQFRHDADQDRAGRQARRRRPVARPQGRQDHRQGAPFDAGRRPHLAAAASRHLFDRGPGAAHLRSEERQSRRRRLGQARLRGRRRHGRGRRLEGALRPRHHRRVTRAAPARRR